MALYHVGVIQDFRCKETEKIWKGRGSRRFPADIQRVALRKLTQLSAAEKLDDMRVPPGNRMLEKWRSKPQSKTCLQATRTAWL